MRGQWQPSRERVSPVFQRRASAGRLSDHRPRTLRIEEDGMRDTTTNGAQAARTTNLALWVLQAALAFQFAAGGLAKLAGTPDLVELFADIGAGQWLRYLVGALEVAGAAGLLVPRLSGLAALGLAGLMVGATATNLFVIGESLWLPIGLLLVSALIARLRWSQTKALALHRRDASRRT
jgi:uncharacterized membrane protein YphA (DoxX/SURF4 family)